MESELTLFEKKILDFLKGHYNQQFAVGNHSKKEAKRLSKAKNDITVKITNSMNSFMLLSEIIRISSITSDRATSQDTKYIREKYTDLNPDIVKSTLNFNLVGEEYVLQYFKNLQRELATNVFNLDMMKKLLESIFEFHPQGIIHQDLKGHETYKNANEINDSQYKDKYRKYYRDMASMLVESGIKEIKKNLHPKKDEALIHNLDFTVNVIKRMDYQVEEIKQSRVMSS